MSEGEDLRDTNQQNTPPLCDADGCSHPSEYLLASGDWCSEHAGQEEPETVRYLAWAGGDT